MMEIQQYLENKKNLQLALLNFLDSEYNHEENYHNLIKLITDYKISEDPNELKTILHLILKLSKDHQRSTNFFSKIEQILKYFKTDILRYFSPYCIFNMFRSNKRILLFLIEEKMIIIDQNIVDIISHYSYKNDKYVHYFYPEIKDFISENVKNQINEESKQFEKDYDKNFEEKRKIGENDNYICQLIRNDSIEDFISFVNLQNWSLKASVEISIYETNSFLHKINPTLIEYAAFFGSEQIFKYLLKNGADFTSNIWLFAVHGRNPEIFQILEDVLNQPENELYNDILDESIKSHNIEVTNYILNNYKMIKEDEEQDDNFIKGIKYYNYNFFPDILSSKQNDAIFYDLCKYNHSKIVELIMSSQKVEFDQNQLLTTATEKNNKEIIQLIIRYNGIVPYSFYKCRELCEIAIPSSVKSIDDFAFSDCTKLTQLTIPFSVISIGKESISRCISLQQIVIPSSVTEIGDGCFAGCSSLKRISIPSSLTRIKEETFYLCSSLQQILIPSSVKIIESGAFKGCSSLKQVKIADSVVEIGEYAFCWCSSLVEVSIPNSVKSVGISAFMVCSSLEKVEISNALTSIEDHCFSFCQSLKKVVIPSSVISIGDYAFYSCNSLKSAVIPPSVTSIGEEAFSGCSQIENFKIPPTVIEIKRDAFKGFHLLDQIDVSPSVDSIGLGILVQ